MEERKLRAPTRSIVASALEECGVAEEELRQQACKRVRFRYGPTLPEGAAEWAAWAILTFTNSVAVTFRDRVYVDRSEYPRFEDIPGWLVAHEVVHVVQYLRDGTASFLLRYGADFMKNLLAHGSPGRAYHGIEYERRAYMVGGYAERQILPRELFAEPDDDPIN